MSASDLATAIELWRVSEGVGLNESDSPEQLEAYLRRNPDMSFVARNGARQMVGAVLCGHDGRRGYLHHLAVARSARRHGVGRSLIESCLAKLSAEGIAKCNIFVYAHNLDGQEFWRRLGWAGREDLLVMQTFSPR